jgi:hypothetical protein
VKFIESFVNYKGNLFMKLTSLLLKCIQVNSSKYQKTQPMNCNSGDWEILRAYLQFTDITYN